jgi:hypothetical protein
MSTQDDQIDAGKTKSVPWIHGWNFTTDLYRILEHIVENSQQTSNAFTCLFPIAYAPDSVLAHIQSLYMNLPSIFKEANAMTGNPDQDRYTFQTANIIVTMQVGVTRSFTLCLNVFSPIRPRP